MSGKIINRVLAVALLCMSPGVAAGVAAAAPSATMLALACTGCHGSRGVSVGASIPGLAGLPGKCMIEAMREFRNGTRPATVMGRLAKAYSDAEIAALADYFSRQPAPAAVSAGKGCSSQ